MHEKLICLLFLVCLQGQMVHWIIINKRQRFQICALKCITFIYNHLYIIYKISNPLKLHQNAKVNPPYGIVWRVHS